MSGNGNHGTVNGATLGTDRHGVADKAYSFDGVDDFIRVARSDRIGLMEVTDPCSIHCLDLRIAWDPGTSYYS